MAFLYMLEDFPPRLRLLGVVLGFGTLQLGAPLARVISADLLQIALWRGLHVVDVAWAFLRRSAGRRAPEAGADDVGLARLPTSKENCTSYPQG